MEELQRIATYSDFKQELDKTFTGISEGFVRAGYLLKQARDTDILRESGYKSVTEFAATEYGLTETYVSRFIAINDRYSEGGYSDRLQERYRGYGMSKLAEMLTLPEQLADAIPPELSREEIREVKREVAEENKITDLEVMLEGQQDTDLSLAAQAMRQFFYENPEKYYEMMNAIKRDEGDTQEESVLDILAPSGAAVLMVRLMGIGKLMISIQGLDRGIEIQNVRTLEGETVTWSRLIDEIFRVYGQEAPTNPEAVWEEVYGESFPEQGQREDSVELEKPEEKEKIAPAQAGQPEPITKKGEEDGTEEYTGNSEGVGAAPERQQDTGGQEAEAAPEGETVLEGDGEPAEEPETCCDVATEIQGAIVSTEAELDSAAVEDQVQQEEKQREKMSEYERRLREEAEHSLFLIRRKLELTSDMPITMSEAREAHAAGRNLLAILDRIYNIKEKEQDEIEGQMSLEDMEEDYVSE